MLRTLLATSVFRSYTNPRRCFEDLHKLRHGQGRCRLTRLMLLKWTIPLKVGQWGNVSSIKLIGIKDACCVKSLRQVSRIDRRSLVAIKQNLIYLMKVGTQPHSVRRQLNSNSALHCFCDLKDYLEEPVVGTVSMDRIYSLVDIITATEETRG